jgi:hypothetical protein
MYSKKVAVTCLLFFSGTTILPGAPPKGGTVSGKVTLSGALPKPKPLDLSKQPECVKMHASNPLFPEDVVIGLGNGLRNVVVYVSSEVKDDSEAPPAAVMFDQQGCHYTTHVLAVRTGQEIKVSNSDPFAHNIHPLAKINREWNKMQLPETPPFSYAYNHDEFIAIKCNIHPWMHGYFAIMKSNHFAVSGDDGSFLLPDLPAGHYTVTAWHETYGTQTKEISITDFPWSVRFNSSDLRTCANLEEWTLEGEPE